MLEVALQQAHCIQHGVVKACAQSPKLPILAPTHRSLKIGCGNDCPTLGTRLSSPTFGTASITSTLQFFSLNEYKQKHTSIAFTLYLHSLAVRCHQFQVSMCYTSKVILNIRRKLSLENRRSPRLGYWGVITI
jgi:hypothetical protein